ncbi:MAG: hypothetical protein U9Q88_21410 [Bacillota bacterium]|nr:hypothetical protein [Bacillota bacterium]
MNGRTIRGYFARKNQVFWEVRAKMKGVDAKTAPVRAKMTFL